MKPFLLAIMLLMAVLAGCTTPDVDADIEISHVHGFGYEPGADAVFVATHNGLAKGVRSGDSWSWSYVGEDRHDYMGFTQDSETPTTFYSSGHPSNSFTYGGPHMGLRRSTDSGASWTVMSHKGEVDFHALTSIPGAEGWIAGSWQGKIKMSQDGGATWSDLPAPPTPVMSLAAAEGRLYAGTGQGIFVAEDLEDLGDWERLEGDAAPAPVTTLTASRDGETLFAATGTGRGPGSSYRSVDGGETWLQLEPPALREVTLPVHFAIDPTDPSNVFASTFSAHVLESTDRGATWDLVREG